MARIVPTLDEAGIDMLKVRHSTRSVSFWLLGSLVSIQAHALL